MTASTGIMMFAPSRVIPRALTVYPDGPYAKQRTVSN